MSENVTKEANLDEYLNEKRLYTFEPNTKGTNCWLTLEDIPDKNKAKIFYFETMGKNKRYMTPVQKNGKEYAKIYIVGCEQKITILYVEKYAVYQRMRVYRK